MRIPPPLAVLVALVLVIDGGRIKAQSTDYVVLEVPGFNRTTPWAVNERGDVVGVAVTDVSASCPSLLEYHGFLYRDGEYTPLSMPGAVGTIAYAINDHGVVLGHFWTSDSQRPVQMFTYWRGEYQAISVPRFESVVPGGINNRGDIVGWSNDYPFEPFILTNNGELTILAAPPGVFHIFPFAINSSGLVVGGAFYQLPGGQNGRSWPFAYQHGEVSRISGLPDSFVRGVNDRGDLLLFLYPAGTEIYRDGQALNLGLPAARFPSVTGLSNTWAVGSFDAELIEGTNCFRGGGFIVPLP